MKIIASVSIYFNESIGYVIFPQYKIENTEIRGKVNVFDVVRVGDEENLGNSILKNVDISINAPNVRMEEVNSNDFYKKLGYKNLKSFSKNFKYITLTLLENSTNYIIEKWDNCANKGYIPPKKGINYIELSKKVDKIIISKIIKKMAESDNVEDLSLDMSFKTARSNVVNYHNFENYDYNDIGDGHTDAYQIYVHDTYDKNYIGFMIDSGYDSFSSKDIQNKWKQYYGDLNTFKYKEISNTEYYAKVVATTNALEIQSYLFKDGEWTLELIFEIDLVTTPKEEQDKIRDDFMSLVESTKINSK